MDKPFFGLTQQDVGAALCMAYYADTQAREGRARNQQTAYADVYRADQTVFEVIDTVNDRMASHRPRGNGHHLGGASFIALRHRETGQIVIAVAGLESDGRNSLQALGDSIDDAVELAFYSMNRQTTALRVFVRRLQRDYKQDPVLVSHSMGTIPARAVSAMLGMPSVEFEPRPASKRFERNMLKRIFLQGRAMHPLAYRAHNAANVMCIVSDRPNSWNTGRRQVQPDGSRIVMMSVETELPRTGSISDPGHRVDTAAAALAGYRTDVGPVLAL